MENIYLNKNTFVITCQRRELIPGGEKEEKKISTTASKIKLPLLLQKSNFNLFSIIASIRQAAQHLYSRHSPDYWSPEHTSPILLSQLV